MKKRTLNLNSKVFVVGAIILFAYGCSTNDPTTATVGNPPTLTTAMTVSEVTSNTAICGGTVTDDKGKTVTARGVCWSTSINPTIKDNLSQNGSGIGTFSCNLTNLSPSTSYYVRAFATNSVGTSYGSAANFTTLASTALVDADGNVYQTIKIGNQTWMAENLRVTKYRNGDQIATTIDPLQDLSSYSSPKYQWASNGDESLAAKYGRYYTVSTVTDGRGLAPKGWHIPTNEDWDILQNYLISKGYNYDGTTVGNKIAKSLASKTDWTTNSNVGSPGNDLSKNNISGFSALPNGYRWNDKPVYFSKIGGFGVWWSSTLITYTAGSALDAVWLGLDDGIGIKHSSVGGVGDALTVRCIKD